MCLYSFQYLPAAAEFTYCLKTVETVDESCYRGIYRQHSPAADLKGYCRCRVLTHWKHASQFFLSGGNMSAVSGYYSPSKLANQPHAPRQPEGAQNLEQLLVGSMGQG